MIDCPSIPTPTIACYRYVTYVPVHIALVLVIGFLSNRFYDFCIQICVDSQECNLKIKTVQTWYINDWNIVEVLAEQLSIQSGRHQYDADVWSQRSKFFHNQQQEITGR